MEDTSWQSREANGFQLAAFTVDWAAHKVMCPEGHSSVKWCPTHDRHGNDVIPHRVRHSRLPCLPESAAVHPCCQGAARDGFAPASTARGPVGRAPTTNHRLL